MSERKLIRWHLGLGDALICNGMVRVMADCGERLLLPCYAHNAHSVVAMFADLGKAIKVVSVTGDEQLRSLTGPSCDLGYYGENFDRENFDESFYEQAGVPLFAMRSWFKLPSSALPQPFVIHPVERFIHDDTERGFVIPMEGYRPDHRGTIFTHAPEMLGANELHCINSSFAILSELIQVPGRRYLHAYARDGEVPSLLRDWQRAPKPN